MLGERAEADGCGDGGSHRGVIVYGDGGGEIRSGMLSSGVTPDSERCEGEYYGRAVGA